jgi:hypothetical protein
MPFPGHFPSTRPLCYARLDRRRVVPVNVAALSEGVVKAMFGVKLKNAVVLATVALVLTAGAGDWRYAAGAGQPEKQPEPKPDNAARDVRPVEEPKRPMIVPPDRRFQINLHMVREKDGQRKPLASPQLLVSEVGKQASFGLPDRYAGAVPVSDGKLDLAGMGPMVRVRVRGHFGDKICLDMTVNQPTRGRFGRDDTTVEAKSIRVIRKLAIGEPTTVKLKTGEKESTVLEVTAAIRVIEKPTDPKTVAAAEKDLQFAGFYQRTGYLDWARFYYELILSRYPETLYAERAKKGLSELKEIVRVGQIFLIGNEKTSDAMILGQVPIFPGQFLTFHDLQIARQIAEQNLSRLKGLKSNPKVTVIEGAGEFKDIEITVEEK